MPKREKRVSGLPNRPPNVSVWGNRATLTECARLLDSLLTREVCYWGGSYDHQTGYPIVSWVDHDSRHLKDCRIGLWTNDYMRTAGYDAVGGKVVLNGAPCSVRCAETRQALANARRVLGLGVDETL